MTFARQGNDSRAAATAFPAGRSPTRFFRVLGDALFWTFHPWSPFSVYALGRSGWDGGYDGAALRSAGRRAGPRGARSTSG